MSKYKPYWYNGGLVPVHYIFIPNEKVWNEVCKSFGRSLAYPKSGAACTVFNKPGECRCLVTVLEDLPDTTPESITGLIAHEAVHVMQFVCENMGEEQPSLELFAYGVQRVYQNMLHEYLLYNKKTGIKWKK